MQNIICIGRQYGSGGREIGEKLSRVLGIPCYDKLLIKKASLESGLSEEFIERTEETPISSIQFLSGNPYADIAGIGNTFYSESQQAYNAEQNVIEFSFLLQHGAVPPFQRVVADFGRRKGAPPIGKCAPVSLRLLPLILHRDRWWG